MNSPSVVTPVVAPVVAPVVRPPLSIQTITDFPSIKVTSSAIGNLSPPSSVLSPSISDWLTDRWQAASDMSGTPIPGPHFLSLSFPSKRITSIKSVTLDFETAHCDDYTVSLLSSSNPERTVEIYSSLKSKTLKRLRSHQHVTDVFDVNWDGVADDIVGSYDTIRIGFLKPATRWGISVWRVVAEGSVEATI